MGLGVGVGVGLGVGVGVGLGVGVGVGLGVGVGVGLGVGVGVGIDVKVGVDDGVSVGAGEGVTVGAGVGVGAGVALGLALTHVSVRTIVNGTRAKMILVFMPLSLYDLSAPAYSPFEPDPPPHGHGREGVILSLLLLPRSAADRIGPEGDLLWMR